jgi:UDPglucose 6-dehydrogenase
MKTGSDNFRASAIQGIMNRLLGKGINLFIFEPEYLENRFHDIEVIKDFNQFINNSDIIITNRMDEQILPIKDKVYTRDIFNKD